MAPQHRQSSPRGTPLKFGWNRGGVALLSRKPAISLKRGKIGPSLLLMTSRKISIEIPIRAFDWCQNQRSWMTFKGHYALCFKTRASFEAHNENFNEDRPVLWSRRCSPVTLDSGNIRLMRIFAAVPWRGGV